tara:strand:- start:31284 stop:31472 length:189 start_codon:yes stop_codon:yes gene_type:complete
MTCETQRIIEAQDNFFKWCMQNLPVGRAVSRKDIESINRVTHYNLLDRERLFGSSQYRWYQV